MVVPATLDEGEREPRCVRPTRSAIGCCVVWR